MDLTKGQGVAAVYDSVGKDTIMGSLDCLKTFGILKKQLTKLVLLIKYQTKNLI